MVHFVVCSSTLSSGQLGHVPNSVKHCSTSLLAHTKYYPEYSCATTVLFWLGRLKKTSNTCKSIYSRHYFLQQLFKGKTEKLFKGGSYLRKWVVFVLICALAGMRNRELTPQLESSSELGWFSTREWSDNVLILTSPKG